MGLQISHGAFDGTYYAFHRFRQAVAKVIGGSYPPHDDQTLDPQLCYWSEDPRRYPGLMTFLSQPDCEGTMAPQDAAAVAHELERLLPALDALGSGEYGISEKGGYGGVARQFLVACRAAARRAESLRFGRPLPPGFIPLARDRTMPSVAMPVTLFRLDPPEADGGRAGSETKAA